MKLFNRCHVELNEIQTKYWKTWSWIFVSCVNLFVVRSVRFRRAQNDDEDEEESQTKKNRQKGWKRALTDPTQASGRFNCNLNWFKCSFVKTKPAIFEYWKIWWLCWDRCLHLFNEISTLSWSRSAVRWLILKLKFGKFLRVSLGLLVDLKMDPKAEVGPTMLL